MDRWLLRMARWVRHPPSEKRVYTVVVVVLIRLAIVGTERLGFWPDWATTQRMRR